MLLKRRLFLLPSCSFVSLVVAALLLGCAGPPKHATWKNATGGGEYERLMWKAIARKDWQEVDRHLAPLFVGVSAGGRVLDRTGWLDYWKGQGVEEALLSELQTRPSGQDMVVTFVLQLSGTTPVAVDAKQMYRVISVWQQVKSGWILTTTSMIPVTPQ
jgi:hypothetical protein